MRVVALAARVKLDESAHGLGAEEPSARALLREQVLAQEALHLRAEPVADGHAEAHLGALQILGRQKLRQRLLQDVLRRQASQLQLLRQRGGELYDVMVEERRARF